MFFLSCHPTKDAALSEPGSHGVLLEIDTNLALPFAEIGDPPPEATVTLFNRRDDTSSSLQFTLNGPFEVEGTKKPLSGNEERSLTVRYTGSMDEPTLASGLLTISAEGQRVSVALSAVVGNTDLPVVHWKNSEGLAAGEYLIEDFATAPFPHESASYTDASVAVYLPAGFSDTDFGVVTWLHGHNAHLTEIIDEQHLFELHYLSGRNSILIVPQGPYEAADGNFGKLMENGGLSALIQDVLATLYREGMIQQLNPASYAIASHSGGYRATASILDDPLAPPMDTVLLYDSLYGEEDSFQHYASEGVLRSVYTESGGTLDNNEDLSDDLKNLAPSDSVSDAALYSSSLTIALVPAAHGECMWENRLHARLLRASSLAPRPDAPAELLSTQAELDKVTLSWREDGVRTWRVEGSQNGDSWSLLTDTSESSATVPVYPFLRVRPGTPDNNGLSSDVYGAAGAELLVVDGFDRVIDGSYRGLFHDFAARAGVASGLAFSIASDEAVEEGRVELTDYPLVIWLLGDESTGDITFSNTQERLLSSYLEKDGRLVLSGSEIGYASDADWLESSLHARYLADDANSSTIKGGSIFPGGSWSFGVTYPEDYPDVLDGETVLWSYSTGAAAAVGWSQQIAVIGFPLETLEDDDLQQALSSLIGWLE